jgi:hypothetical protein
MVRPAGRRAGAALLAGALAGCSLITDSFLTNDFSGDPFPTQVDTSSGALLVGMQPLDQRPNSCVQPADQDKPRRAVLDLLAPFTLVDPCTTADPTLTAVDVRLFGKNTDGMLDLARGQFPQVQLITLHPCEIPAGADPKQLPECIIGTPGASQTFDAVIGADTLAGDAIRLRLASDQIFVLPDIGGSDRNRTLACDVVFDAPYRGGGTLVISGTELPFGNRRITLQACLGGDLDPDPQFSLDDVPSPGPTDDPSLINVTYDPRPDPRPDSRCLRERTRSAIAARLQPRGTDALFVVSTSIRISILSTAAYRRYIQVHPEATAVESLPADAVYLPSGLIKGGRATINPIALIGAPSSNQLAACRQLYAHRLLAALGPIDANEFDSCPGDNGQPLDAVPSPCKDGTSFCPVPAIVELTPSAGVDVLVVDDTDPTLQALRTELRPDQPEVDGILGTDVLRGAEIDVDYPHDRLLARCPGANCSARPALAEQGDRCQINRCIKGLQDFRTLVPMGAAQADKRNLPGCTYTPPGN